MSTEAVDLSQTPASNFLNTPEGRAILRLNLDRYCGEPTRVSGGKTDYVIRCVLSDHVDQNPSMVVTFEDEDAQVFCRSHPGGWDQDKLLEATKLIAQEEFQTWVVPAEQVEGHDNGKPQDEEPVVTVIEIKSSSKWFEDYTKIPFSEWESWGTEARAECIGFTSKESPAARLKYPDGRRLIDPTGARLPHTWPDVPDEPGIGIWLTEGETDAGSLRHLGFPAYSYGTKNANPPTAFWESLKAKGVQVLYFIPDIDDAGREGVKKLKQKCIEADLPAIVVDISPVLNVGAGEKDVRDLWLREDEAAKDLIYECLELSLTPKKPFSISFGTYAKKYQVGPTQIIPGWSWLSAIGLNVGEPGAYKSFVAEAKVVSECLGVPFIDGSEPKQRIKILYLPMEDGHSMTVDRIALLLGGSIRQNHEPREGVKYAIDITFPSKSLEEIDQWLHVHDARQFNLTDLESWAEHEQDVQNHGIQKIYIDPVFAAVGDDQTGDYFAKVATMIARYGKTFRDRTGCGIELIHHRSHRGNAWGSIFIGALREMRTDFEKINEHTIKVNRYVKWSGHLKPLQLTFDVPPEKSDQEGLQIDAWFHVEVGDVETMAVKSVKRETKEGQIMDVVIECLRYGVRVRWTVDEIVEVLDLEELGYVAGTAKNKVQTCLTALTQTDEEDPDLTMRERRGTSKRSPFEYFLASRKGDLL